MSASEPLPRPSSGAPVPSDGTRSGRSGAFAGASAGASAGTPTPARGSGPAPLEVVCEGLIAIVREMRATTIRPSFSSVIDEFDDFSCAVFEPGGEMVAQSWDHPEHVFPAALLLRSRILEYREQPIRAALNEPFLIAGGSLAVRMSSLPIGSLRRQISVLWMLE